MIQLLDMIAQQILILGLEMITQGQNKISRALIWGKVHLCRPNMTRDMIKNVKMAIFKKFQILRFCSINWHFWKSLFFLFYHISGHIWPTHTSRNITYISTKFWQKYESGFFYRPISLSTCFKHFDFERAIFEQFKICHFFTT